MQTASFFSFWAPRIRLNTDIVPIQKASVPTRVRLFTEHDRLEVETGAAVKTGQRLAPDLVSPVTGDVTDVSSFRGPDGLTLTSISLDVAGEDDIQEGLSPLPDFEGRQRDELAAALSDLGCHIDVPSQASIAVVNGLDLDPAQAINQQTLREDAAMLPDAVSLLKALTGAARIVVATTPQLRNLTERHAGAQAEIVELDPVYPNGLPEVILRRLGDPNGAAADGFVVGIERLFAMVAALKSGKPVQDKLLTLSVLSTGLCKNLRARIGAPIDVILQEHDIDLGANGKLITGGVMRGVACYSTDFAVTPETDSITVQHETDVAAFEPNACLNCGKCSAACPMDLRVDLICRYSEYGLFERCRELDIDACILCGLCAYSCTARRPLIHLLKLAKAELAAESAAKGGQP